MQLTSERNKNLSIGAMAAGQHEYYAGLAATDDYYVGGLEPAGVWFGRGAEVLGCRGIVTKEALQQLCDGFSVLTGEKLVQNAGKENRVPGWDFTYSAPKSVSVAWSQGDAQQRSRIEQAHDSAVRTSLALFEKNWAFCRAGKNGIEVEHASVAIATFQHSTNRNQEPHLHTHALVQNVGVGEDGRTRALDSRHLLENKMLLGALYRCELSFELTQKLGFSCERHKSWFELSGVPQSLCENFSSRRQEILEHLRSRGLESAAAAAIATLATRQAKQQLPREELLAGWQEEGRRHGFSISSVLGINHRSVFRTKEYEFAEAFGLAVERLSAGQSHFTERQLLRAVAEESQGRGLSVEEVIRRLDHELKHNHHIVQLGRRDRDLHFTTREMLETERRLLAAVEQSKGDKKHVASASSVDAVLRTRATIVDEQRAALLHVTRDEGSIKCVSGIAGSGKSYIFKAAREVWEREGFAVYGAALAGKAAQGFMDDSGIRSTTIHKTIKNIDEGKFFVTPRTVIVIDEAGTVPTRLMERLVSEVQKGGGKLVCAGDARQLQPVEAGAPFQAMCERLGDVKLTQIIRQREEWAKEAVKEFAAGEAQTALKRYAEKGLVHVAENRDAAITALVKAYANDGLTGREVKEKLILAGTNYEVAIINSKVQAERQKAGLLGMGAEIGSALIREGDRVVFTKRNTVLGLENGSFGTVVRYSEEANLLHVRLDTKERLVAVPLVYYDAVRLGYAVTDFKAQGATVERAFVLTGGMMTHREASYVEASRARERTTFFTDRHEAGDELSNLAKQMTKSRAKDLAHDILQRQGPELSLQAHF